MRMLRRCDLTVVSVMQPRGPSAFRFAPISSFQPVLGSQAWHLREVGRVAGEERGVVRQSDAGDFQIHRADARTLMAQLEEKLRGVGIPREYRVASVSVRKAKFAAGSQEWRGFLSESRWRSTSRGGSSGRRSCR